MAKKVTRIAKLQFIAGQAKPGPMLAGLGIDMGGFTKQFNEATKDRGGEIVPVIITAYSDRSFDFETKTAPTSFMLKNELNLKSGAKDQTEPIKTVSVDVIRRIAEYKMKDLNTNDINAAIKIVEGTARNMGIVVENMTPKKIKKGSKIKKEEIKVEEKESEEKKIEEDNK